MFFVRSVLESSCFTAFDFKAVLTKTYINLSEGNWFANTSEMKLHTAIKKNPTNLKVSIHRLCFLKTDPWKISSIKASSYQLK